MADVTILGGGVIGLSIAGELARAGATVRVLDRADFGTEASWAGAGMLPPGNLERASTPEALLRGLSHGLWLDFTGRLESSTGVDSGYRVSGAVRLFGDDTERDAELAAWKAEGIPAEVLDEDSLGELEPGLAAGLGPALHLPGQAQIRNPRHLKSLVASCAREGVELLSGVATTSWEVDGDHVYGVRTPQGVFQSDRYCVAAGAWSGGLLESLGVELPVRPVRGQIVLLGTRPLPFFRMIELGPRYLVPRPDGRVLVGATQEEAGFEKRNTAAAVGELLRLATDLCPALESATVERTWAGLRPGSADGLPYLGRVPEFENLFVAAGHFRAGLQMSPGTARVMRQVLLDQPTDIPLDGFAVDRHAAMVERF